MYPPPHFHVTNAKELADFIQTRRFAILVVSGPDGPRAAHIPMILNRDEMGHPISLEGHVAKANPVAAFAASATPALAVFTGADAYVTPSLYLSKREHGRVVPTWNYIAVHAAGSLEAFTDAATLYLHIERLTNLMEYGAAAPWSVRDAPADYIAKMIGGIVGLRLAIDSVEGIRKLSQNRTEGDRAGVLDGFAHSNDPAAQTLAREMSRKP